MHPIRARTLVLAIASVAASGSLEAGPATPSSFAIERSLVELRSAWAGAEGDDVRRAGGWNEIASAIENALAAHAAAPDGVSRRRALDRVAGLSDALRSSAWPSAVRLRGEIESWLRPRMAIDEASRRLREALQALPSTSSPEVAANRERWSDLDERLSAALRDYESSTDPVGRARSLEALRSTLSLIRSASSEQPWSPASSLRQALESLFEHPNVEAVADLSAVSPFLSQQVVFSEILYYKGQYSYITPGPKTGFGLLPNEDGLSFYNSQIAYSVTPVLGFQEQVAADSRGRFLTRLYQLSATIYNTSEARVFITVRPRPGGISINPRPTNNVDAKIGADKLPGHHPHLTRTAISLVGFDQDRIEQQIYENGIDRIRQEAATSSREIADYRAAEAQVDLNNQATRYLVGERRIEIGPVALTGTELRSQPSFVGVRGRIQSRMGLTALGADYPLPAEFGAPGPGVTADLHLPSTLTNVVGGLFQSAEVQEVENLLIETRPPESGEPAIQTQKNIDFSTYLEAIQRAQGLNDPGAQAIRVFRPARSPEFLADRDGNLAIVVRDFKVDLPTPPAAARGGLAGPPARVYRVVSPSATVTLSLQLRPVAVGEPAEVEATIVSFDPGRETQVFAINTEEADAQRLNVLTSTVVLGALRSQFVGRSIRQPLDSFDLQGFALQSASALHPTGWIRVNLARVP